MSRMVLPGAIVLSGRDLELIRWTVATTQLVCRRDHGLESVQLAALAADLRSAASPNGQTARPIEPDADPDLVTTAQLSTLFGYSERTARRRAHTLGQKVGGRWFTPVQAVREYEGATQ